MDNVKLDVEVVKEAAELFPVADYRELNELQLAVMGSGCGETILC